MICHQIVVDDREQKPTAAEQVAGLKKLGVPASVGRLAVGDFAWTVEGPATIFGVVVERKSIADFLSSVPPNDRLHRFIEETGGITPPPNQVRAVLLEGNQFELPGYGERRWTPEMLDDALVSLQTLGVMVLRSENQRETAARLAAFWKWTGKDEHRTFLAPVLPTLSKLYFDKEQMAAVRMVMALPGFGEGRAYDVLSDKGSVQAVLEALASGENMAVKGIGKGLVEKGRSFLNRRVF